VKAQARRPAGEYFRAFEQSGVFVMRAGRDRSADYLLLRATGPRGVWVAGGGEEILSASCSSEATGPEGGRRAEPAEAEGPRSVAFRAGPPCDYVRVISALGGRGDAGGGATHRREVVFFERRYWVLSDRVRAEEPGGCSLELSLHSAPESTSPDGRRFVAGGLLVVLAGPTDTGFTFREDEDGRTLARADSEGRDVNFVTLFFPLREEEPRSVSVEPVTSEAGRDAGLRLSLGQAENLVVFAHGEKTEAQGLGDGVQAAALSRSGGKWRTLFEISS
jgi:hypothetical protein